MFPGLRLGWLVVPARLLPDFREALRLAGSAPSILVQAAMADFMAEGLFTAHLRRMRALYAERRTALLTPGRPGLIIGYANMPATGMAPAMATLRRVLETFTG